MTNTKKWLIITVAIAFGITLIAALIMLFSVKKVAAEFSVYGKDITAEMRKELESFRGKSLVFLDTAEVYAVGDKYPDYEITAVEKEYPNILKVKVVKRTELFKVVFNDKSFVLDGEGYILNDAGVTENPRNVMPITLGDISVESGEVGKKLVTSDDGLFYSVLKTAQALNLSDSVKNVSIYVGVLGQRDAVFTTYTGVAVEVRGIEDDGDEKIRKAFSLYESGTLGDYEKSSDKILAYKEVGGEIVAVWTSH